MLIALLSIAIFAVPICGGLFIIAAGVVLLIISFKKTELRKWSFVSIVAGAVTAGTPAAILAFIFISDRVKNQVVYDSLPGKVEVDISMDREGFFIDGEYYKQLRSYNGRDINKHETGITLVDGIYTHFALEQLEDYSPYDLYYTDMFSSTYCREEDYDSVIQFYDTEPGTRVEMKNMRGEDHRYIPIDAKLVGMEIGTYNEYYHIYHPYGLTNSVNESHVDTIRLTLADDYREYRISTYSTDGIYETCTTILLQNDHVYIKYHGTDEEATVAELGPLEEDFYRTVADGFEEQQSEEMLRKEKQSEEKQGEL